MNPNNYFDFSASLSSALLSSKGLMVPRWNCIYEVTVRGVRNGHHTCFTNNWGTWRSKKRYFLSNSIKWFHNLFLSDCAEWFQYTRKGLAKWQSKSLQAATCMHLDLPPTYIITHWLTAEIEGVSIWMHASLTGFLWIALTWVPVWQWCIKPCWTYLRFSFSSIYSWSIS